jgi:hypothetical protein
MSERVRRPLTPAEPLNKFQINLLMRDEIGRSTQAMIEDSRASRSAARILYPTPSDRQRQAAKPAQAKPESSPRLSRPRGAVSPLGGTAIWSGK